ncbi:MAG: endonuclease/exonuclease/phosphatase family protein [Chloroflexota bacterium]|nr:endonuclease/exonuclease/phosphatase family protein [Chloroflexota bacterium]
MEWATPRSRRTPEILDRLEQTGAEVVCLTETHRDLLAGQGYGICAQEDYGYPVTEGRRKVALWSREPWQEVDDVGSDGLPPGRYVSGVTHTSVGAIRVVGICIPWSGCRTESRRGAERKLRWEDHEQYLARLPGVLKGLGSGSLVVMGDFNQVIGPGSRAPLRLRSALTLAFPTGIRIVTPDLEFQGRESIDHIAVSDDLVVESVGIVSNLHGDRKLSDHYGVFADLAARD